jgi:FkbM family methyltransferase
MIIYNRKIGFIISIFSALIILYYLITYSNSNSTNIVTDIVKENKFKTNKKRYAFFDLGTNNGDSVKFFIDKIDRTDKDSYLKGYGAIDNKKWEIYAVEANPFFNEILGDVKKYSEDKGHKFNLFTETAAWTKNEKLTFWLDTVNAKRNYYGSSLLKIHPHVIKSGYKNVSVQGIDISELLKQYNENDEVVLKIDIEGSEYDIFLHLIKEGTLSLVDIIAVEFHRIIKDTPTNELEQFFNAYFRFFNIKIVPWY